MDKNVFSFTPTINDERQSLSIKDGTIASFQRIVGRNSQTESSRRHSNVFDVAKYILHELGSMTTMKLQKLVYYCQAWSLAWDEEPLFDEEFEAWANGPVCPALYDAHRGQYVIHETDLVQGNIGIFTDSQIDSINTVLNSYGDKAPQWLSELTHKERPWLEARGTTPVGERCNAVISKESMQDYYAGLIQ